jgi:hypothetical protein
VKYLPLFHHFKGIYHFPKHIIFLVKIVANAALINPASILLGGLVGKKYFDVNLISYQCMGEEGISCDLSIFYILY